MAERAWAYPLEAIQCALGSALLAPRPSHPALRKLGTLTGEDMPEPYSHILAAIQNLRHSGQAVDIVTVRASLNAAKVLSSDAAEILIACAEAVPTAENGPEYCEIVASATAARKAHAKITAAAKQVETASDVREVEAVRRNLMAGLRETRKRRVEVQRKLADYDALAVKPYSGIPTIFPTINKLMTGKHHGYSRGTLNIVGGKRGTAKTNFMLQQAIQTAKAGVPVLVLSLEMTQEQLGGRLMHMLTGSGSSPFAEDMFDDSGEDWERKKSEAESWPLFIEAHDRLNAQEAVDIMQDHYELGVRLFLLDYLQLLLSTVQGDIWSAVREAADVLRAATLQMPDGVIVGLSQLSTKADGSFSARGGQEWEDPASLVMNLLAEVNTDRLAQPRFAKSDPNADKPLLLQISKNRYGGGTGATKEIYLSAKDLNLYEEKPA